MYKSNHTKSKSDTDFHSNKIINDDISGSLKIFHNNIIKHPNISKKPEKERTKSILKLPNLKVDDEKSQFVSIFEKILLFKKQIDCYFFRKKLPLIKFDLDNTLQIINKKIDDLKNNLIRDCPILEKSILIEKLSIFTEVIKSLIETKPQEFYKEVKLVILTQFEKIRLEIFELLENLHESDNNEIINLHDINKIKKECKFNHGILFNSLKEMNDDDEDDDDSNSLKLTSEIKENIISVILPIKNKILKFIEEISHDILFSLTKFSYIIDYYSLSVSNLNLQLFKNIISYVEKNSEHIPNNMDNTILFLIELIFILNKSFTHKSLIDFKKKVNASESSIQNSMGKFILNNIKELIPKCQGLNSNRKFINKRYFKSLYSDSYKSLLYFKNYMKSFKINKKIKLSKSFKFYYDLKLIFWKSVYTKMDLNAKTSDICCRICEQNIPLIDFVLHVYYCKEQNHYYKKMNFFKSKMKKYIDSLEIYKTKINQKLLTQENNFFKKNGEMNEIFKNIKKEIESINIDKNNSNDFLHTLIKIYLYENNKPNDFYEKYPEKLSILSTLIYLTYFVYIANKKKSLNNKDYNEGNELDDILGNILSILIQILLNTEYLLEARHSRTKSNRYINNIHYSFQSTSNESFFSSTSQFHSSKNLVFNEFSVNNSDSFLNINLNEEIKRKNFKQPALKIMMEDIKNKFSLNKALLKKSKTSFYNNPNISNEESILSFKLSTSNLDLLEDSKSKTINKVNFLRINSNIIENHKSNKELNRFNNYNKSFFYKNFHAKSSFILKTHKDLEIEKEPIKNGHKNNISNLEIKDFSFDLDNNNFENSSKELFLQENKNNNLDSFSGTINNSENENNNNDNFINFCNSQNFTTKTNNNNKLNINSDKKVTNFMLQPEKSFLKHQSGILKLDGKKKSLFQSQLYGINSNNKNQLDIKNKRQKIIHRSSSLDDLEFEERSRAPSENGDKNKDKFLSHQFEKIKIEERKRGKSQKNDEKKYKTASHKNKCLVLIDNYESSGEDNSENDDSEFKSIKKKSIKNIDINFNSKPENKEINENSNDSSYLIDDEDNDYFKVIIGSKDSNEIELKNENPINIFPKELNDYNHAIEEEKNWIIFDTYFFMNSNINEQNMKLINALKELLYELN